MKLVAVRLAALVIIASILPFPRIRAQGQNVITTSVVDASWQYFPCASGVMEKRDTAHIVKRQSKPVIKASDKKRSRRAERRL